MRVLHLLKGLGPGGAERLVVAQSTASAARADARVAYLVPAKDHLVATLADAGVAVDCLDAPSAARLGWMVRLRRLLRAEPVDVLHIHSPALAAVGRLLVRTLPRSHRPAVVGTEHNRWPRHHPVTRIANRATIRLEAATIAVSDDVASTIRGARSGQVRVIEHGVDLAAVTTSGDRAGVRAELDIGDDEVLIACVANLRREKALDVLVAAATIACEADARLRYVLVGQGPLADDLDGWVDAAGLGERFLTLGYRADAPRILSGADVFTLSSTHEGLPVALMEALALGLPVAATAAGGVPAAAGEAGLISPIGDADALARSHLRLAEDEAERRRRAAAARERAPHFSIDRAVGAIEAVYATAIAGDGRRARSHS